MIPEIWLRTCTFLTGLIWPLAVTLWTTSPLATGALRYSTSPSPGRAEYQRQPAPAAAMANTARTHLTHVFFGLAAISCYYEIIHQSGARRIAENCFWLSRADNVILSAANECDSE